MSRPSQSELSDLLSPEGMSACKTMRSALCDEVIRAGRFRRRRRRLTVGAASLVALSGLVSAAILPMVAGPSPHRVVEIPEKSPSHSAEHVAPRIHAVQTDTSVLDRYRITRTAEPTWVTDDELLDAVRATGQSAGIVHRGDKTLLVMNPQG